MTADDGPLPAASYRCRWCPLPVHAIHLIEAVPLRLEVPLCADHWRTCIGVHGALEREAVARASATRRRVVAI